MTIFRDVHYNHNDITTEAIDTNSGKFLWLGFKKDSNGNCRILKTSASDPNQIYFDVNLAIEAINKIHISGFNLFIAADHAANYIYRYSVFNPIASPVSFTRPAGVVESPVDVVEGGSSLWWLIPGIASGEVAKIIKTTTLGNFQQTITLQISGEEVRNAKSLTYVSGELWVVTYTNPAKAVRVFQESGGLWTIQVTSFV
jgi:hypothetical protein